MRHQHLEYLIVLILAHLILWSIKRKGRKPSKGIWGSVNPDRTYGDFYTRTILSRRNDTEFSDIFHMPREAFFDLMDWFRHNTFIYSSRWISVEQKVMIFLYICANNASMRTTASKFQHSTDTIWRVFHEIFDPLVLLHVQQVELPHSNEIPKEAQHIYRRFLGAEKGIMRIRSLRRYGRLLLATRRTRNLLRKLRRRPSTGTGK